MFKNENAVRSWVRKLGVVLEWTEAARGGTDGLPDVRLILPSGAMPVELKWWKLDLHQRYFQARMRREQVRYHAVMAKAGVPTLILWGSPSCDGLWALPGQHAPKAVVGRVWRGVLHVRGYDESAEGRAAFLTDVVWDLENRAQGLN